MPNNLHSQSHQNIFTNQQKPTKNKDAHGDVGQDKRALPRARTASRQPARSHIPMRAEQTTTKTQCSKNPSIATGRKVQLCLWVNPIVKAEIERRAEREGLQPSPVGAAILEKAIQQNIDLEYSALLRPIIESAIKENLQHMSSRMALLLVRVAFSSEQTRSLVTNILSRQPDLSQSPEVLNDILNRSADAAKSKITQKNPDLEKVIAEVKGWFEQEKKTKV
jgi:hypothetical protein